MRILNYIIRTINWKYFGSVGSILIKDVGEIFGVKAYITSLLRLF
jgi:hypothetical protein